MFLIREVQNFKYLMEITDSARLLDYI